MKHYNVAVIGAGVAGLTAAHELAERGFRVMVFESEHDALGDPSHAFRVNADTERAQGLSYRQPVVGGLAATQWYRIPQSWEAAQQPVPPLCQLDLAAAVNLARPEDWWDEDDAGADVRPLAAWEGRWPLLPFEPGDDAISKFVRRRVARIVERLAAILERATTTEYLVIGGVVSPDDASGRAQSADLDRRRAAAVERVLMGECERCGLERGEGPGGQATFLLRHRRNSEVSAQVRVAGLGVLHAGEPTRSSAAQRYVEIRLLDKLLPGEHGYRFFPSFYHHVFDTMRRIPLLVKMAQEPFMRGLALETYRNTAEMGPPPERWEVTARTVFDNLRSVEVHALDSGGEVPVRPMERFNTRSLRGLLDMLDLFQEHADVPLRDVVLGQLKMMRYATSGRSRRAFYEGRTWSQFAESTLGGAQFQRLLDHWPQALVGLQASRADARTTGTVLLQLLLDQARDAGYRDGTLNSPTSEAWLDPWKRYLEHERGVFFSCMRVERFEFDGGRIILHGRACDGQTRITPPEIGLDFHYVVIATSIDGTKRLGETLRAELEQARPDLLDAFEQSPFAGAADLVPKGDRYQRIAASEDPFEHFSGVQFFLRSDFAPLRGHVYYPNSPWRLSSVSQSQFRLDRPGELEGYTGVISVVIGAFDEKGRKHTKQAWHCTPQEIAEEVWDQITWSLQRSPDGVPPLPQYFAIDKNLIFDEQGRLVRNTTPFLVNSADKAGAFPERAGDYQVHLNHFVFAGTYMSTFTRLVTMEAANESARHAVNALIRHGRERGVLRSWANTGQRCPIFDPEDREPGELELVRRIDAELFARGLPHWMDILEVEPRVLELFDRDDGTGKGGVAGALAAVLESAGGIGTELRRLIWSHMFKRL